MDADRFDSVARKLGEFNSRRLALRAAGLAGAVVALDALGLVDADAKKKKKKKVRCGQPQDPCGSGTCCSGLTCGTPKCADATQCCIPVGGTCATGNDCDCCAPAICSLQHVCTTGPR